MPKQPEKPVSLLDVLETDLLLMTERAALALGHLTQIKEVNPHIIQAMNILKEAVAEQCESRAQFAELMGLAITEAKKTSGDAKSITH